MVELDTIIIPFTGVLIFQLFACGFMYSKLKRRIRELEGLVGIGPAAASAPEPSAPVDRGDCVRIPVQDHNQYLGGFTFTPAVGPQYTPSYSSPFQVQQTPPRHWKAGPQPQ